MVLPSQPPHPPNSSNKNHHDPCKKPPELSIMWHEKGRLLNKSPGWRNDYRHKKHGLCMTKEGSPAISGKTFFCVPWIHAINATSRRLNAHTVNQPCPKVLFPSLPTIQKCQVVPRLSSGLKQLFLKQNPFALSVTCWTDACSQNAAQIRLNQFWLPLLYTNMQSYPSRLWPLKCHILFCFMLVIPVGCKNSQRSDYFRLLNWKPSKTYQK